MNRIEHKIIVVGCGVMSNAWLDYAQQRENATIVGLVDINIEVARAMVERRDLKIPAFSDLSKALKKTDANLVFDVTIPAAHKQITELTKNQKRKRPFSDVQIGKLLTR